MRTGRALLAASCALPALAAVAGCGSAPVAQLPGPAGPAGSAPLAAGDLVATVDGRARTLTIRDARTRAARSSAAAGVGPTAVGCVGATLCFVADTRGDALLVFRVGDGGRALRLTRRVFLPGGPEAVVVDPAGRRLRITTRAPHRLALLPAHGRPHVLSWRALP